MGRGAPHKTVKFFLALSDKPTKTGGILGNHRCVYVIKDSTQWLASLLLMLLIGYSCNGFRVEAKLD